MAKYAVIQKGDKTFNAQIKKHTEESIVVDTLIGPIRFSPETGLASESKYKEFTITKESLKQINKK